MRMRASWRVVVIAVATVCLGSSISPSRAQARPSSGGQLFTNGSGWIPLATGGQGTFSVHAGIQKDGTSAGHLVYTDHDVDFDVASASISSFVPDCLSVITGTGDSNLGPVQFAVTMLDAGEPGAGSDIFSIQVFSGVMLIYSQRPSSSGRRQHSGARAALPSNSIGRAKRLWQGLPSARPCPLRRSSADGRVDLVTTGDYTS